MIKSIYKAFQWGCQSHSPLHALPWCGAHGRSIKVIQSCSAAGFIQDQEEDETAEVTQVTDLQGVRLGSTEAASSGVG